MISVLTFLFSIIELLFILFYLMKFCWTIEIGKKKSTLICKGLGSSSQSFLFCMQLRVLVRCFFSCESSASNDQKAKVLLFYKLIQHMGETGLEEEPRESY